MNPDQETFFKCMMDRAQPDKQSELQSFLLETIQSVEKSPLSTTAFNEFKTKVLTLIKPETIDEIEENINHFERQST
jgi:hypothetical protein